MLSHSSHTKIMPPQYSNRFHWEYNTYLLCWKGSLLQIKNIFIYARMNFTFTLKKGGLVLPPVGKIRNRIGTIKNNMDNSRKGSNNLNEGPDTCSG